MKTQQEQLFRPDPSLNGDEQPAALVSACEVVPTIKQKGTSMNESNLTPENRAWLKEAIRKSNEDPTYDEQEVVQQMTKEAYRMKEERNNNVVNPIGNMFMIVESEHIEDVETARVYYCALKVFTTDPRFEDEGVKALSALCFFMAKRMSNNSDDEEVLDKLYRCLDWTLWNHAHHFLNLMTVIVDNAVYNVIVNMANETVEKNILYRDTVMGMLPESRKINFNEMIPGDTFANLWERLQQKRI